MMCDVCTEKYGKITNSPQFNCHGCWGILQSQLAHQKELLDEAIDIIEGCRIIKEYCYSDQASAFLEKVKK